jgi:hypothetical protein
MRSILQERSTNRKSVQVYRDGLPISKSNDIGRRPKDQRSLMKEMFEDRLLTKNPFIVLNTFVYTRLRSSVSKGIPR